MDERQEQEVLGSVRAGRPRVARSVGPRAVALTIGALVCCLLVVSWGYWRLSQSQRPVSLEIDPGQPGLAIARDFMGLSMEWGEAKALMGTPSTGTNPIYRLLLGNLYEYGGSGVVRIGGASADLMEYNGEPDLNEVSAFAQLHKDTGTVFYLSTNLGSSDANLPARQAQSFVKNMPNGALRAIELGNEPDQYGFNGTRPRSYSFADYQREFDTRKSGLEHVLPADVKLMGPSWAGTESLQHLPEFLKAEHGALTSVSQHWYAGVACGGRKNPPDFLLEPTAASSGARAVASSVTLAHDQKLPFRIGEMNSVACNGESGVTDTFASALWMIDALFEFANVGVDGVNVHMATDDVYGPFLVHVDTGRIPYTYSVSVIRPEYYGMVFFQEAAPAGSRLIRTKASLPRNLKCWATIDKHHTVRVALVNKDKQSARTVTVKLQGHGVAAIERLAAASYRDKTGITFAGKTFDNSSDGKAHGTLNVERAMPKDGEYEIQVAPTSAVLLTLERL